MQAAAAGTPSRGHGRVVAGYGQRFLVEDASGALVSCVARGRRSGIVCGDRVSISLVSPAEGVIEAIEPRSCLIYRSDARREKLIAANVTQVVVVLAVAPAPNTDFIDRCLVAAEHGAARGVIVLNKIDIDADRAQAEALLDRYRGLGYRTLATSRAHSLDALSEALEHHVSVLIGQSGVGKSTLVNRLVPMAKARIGETSAARQAGRHTTTHAELYRINQDSALIDSPGMHAFGLSHLGAAAIAHGFVELRGLIGACRFANCRHDGEPDCALDAARRDGRITPERLATYRRILNSIATGEPRGAIRASSRR